MTGELVSDRFEADGTPKTTYNNYTVVGQVESGMEYVDNIKRGEPPVDPDQMISVKVQADL